MLTCVDQALTAAKADVSVLIMGESGTGKNLLAEMIHKAGCRCKGPCVSVNCSALPESLLESELFGHVQGAYTGAHRDHRGKFQLADNGTLVLDEIAELSPAAQAKLLQAVETKRFDRVGGEEPCCVDVRIVSLTNADLAGMVDSRRFRQDLLYRLQEVRIELPPLRQRQRDIPLLIKTFIGHYNKCFGKQVECCSGAAMNFIMAHRWPGNVRELQAVIKRGVLTAKGPQLTIEDLALQVRLSEQEPAGYEDDLSLEAAERRHILKVIKLTDGNKRKAAEILDISRTTLDKKISQYDIPDPT